MRLLRNRKVIGWSKDIAIIIFIRSGESKDSCKPVMSAWEIRMALVL